MNQLSLRVALGASLLLGLGACTVTSSGSSGVGGGGVGGGGVGGDVSDGGAGPTTTTTTANVGGGGTGGSGTGGSAPTCLPCAEAITPELNPNDLPGCEGTSAELLDALSECACGTDGACATACEAFCGGGEQTTECQTCLQDSAAGCGTELSECNNDAG